MCVFTPSHICKTLDLRQRILPVIPPRTPSTHEAHVFVSPECSSRSLQFHRHVIPQRHNFVSVFSYSHTQTLGSGLLEILENDEKRDKPRCWLEEDTATVFVAQDVMARFISLKDMLVPSPLGRVESGVRCIATVASAVAR